MDITDAVAMCTFFLAIFLLCEQKLAVVLASLLAFGEVENLRVRRTLESTQGQPLILPIEESKAQRGKYTQLKRD